MIKTEGLTRLFGDLVAVDDLTLEIESGEVFGLLGPNGAGKTTIVRMLAALISPSQGRAWVAGYEIGKDDAAVRSRVGILTESPGLYDRLSAQRNLSFFAELYGVEDAASRVGELLEMLGLWARRAEPAGTFSKGMRQKLAIARAVLHRPKVLFLDEPTSGLDPEAAKLVREFIDGLRRQGRTILLCTHNLAEADRLCDRIGVLQGRLLALDSPANLRSALFGRSTVVKLAHDAPRAVAAAQELPFVKGIEVRGTTLEVAIDDPEADNPELVRVLVGAGAQVQFVSEDLRPLEDVYLRLVSNGEQP